MKKKEKRKKKEEYYNNIILLGTYIYIYNIIDVTVNNI